MKVVPLRVQSARANRSMLGPGMESTQAPPHVHEPSKFT